MSTHFGKLVPCNPEVGALPIGTHVKHLTMQWLGVITNVECRVSKQGVSQVFYMVQILGGTNILLSRAEFDVVG